MSLTLGEKLREAREERGFTLSEVSEQTRISSLYLESIENDDYRPLPGGIFNKGFVKSYAKFVGVDEHEALTEYSDLLAQTQDSEIDGPVPYRPQVLTDDRASSSAPTIILAIVILAAMTAGVLYLVNYMRRPKDEVIAANTQTSNSNSGIDLSANSNSDTVTSNAPDMATVKVEFKAVSESVFLTATDDGKTSSSLLAPGNSAKFEPKESLKLKYSKSLARAVELEINGKSIALPSEPLEGRRNAIEFEINKDNLAQIWTDGAISKDVPAVEPNPATNEEPAPVETSTPEAVATPTTVRTPVPPTPKATISATTKTTPERKPLETPKPSPTRPVVVIKSANRPDQDQ